MTKFYAADVDDQIIDLWHAEVEDDDVVPGHVLLSVRADDAAEIYLDPAAARGLAAALIDMANKVEY